MASSPITYCGYTPVYSETKKLSIVQPDAVSAGNVAGVYTAAINVPARSSILNVIVDGIALWNAGTSASMDIGDAADPNGHFAAINMKATDLLAGESIDAFHQGGQAGAYFTAPGAATHMGVRYSASARTISAVLTTVGTVPTTGDTNVTVVYVREPAAAGGVRYGTYVKS